MLKTSLVGVVVFAGFMPSVVLASMVYTPSRPCGCVTGCDTSYPNCVCDTVNNQYRDFQKYDNTTAITSTNVRNTAVAGDWYVAGNVVMNLWSWDNEYNSNYGGADLVFNKDEYSFESILGGSVAVGKKFDSGVRGDIEFGFSSEFSDSDDLAEFTMSAPYVMANAYYDFDSGMYLGAGLGIARPITKITGELFESREATGKAWSPKIGMSVGYSTGIADNTFIDFRYRLSLFKGADLSNTFLWEQVTGSGVYERYVLQVESDLILENALSVGLRFNF